MKRSKQILQGYFAGGLIIIFILYVGNEDHLVGSSWFHFYSRRGERGSFGGNELGGPIRLPVTVIKPVSLTFSHFIPFSVVYALYTLLGGY